MTTEDIQRRLSMIQSYSNKGDHEQAHIEEDRLIRDFVRYVGSIDDLVTLSRKARLVGSSSAILFNRHCA